MLIVALTMFAAGFLTTLTMLRRERVAAIRKEDSRAMAAL
jgi:hypothetical protein